ncbi:hypothetical protein EMIT0215P_70019 [Pseudomonas serboccidentalis]
MRMWRRCCSDVRVVSDAPLSRTGSLLQGFVVNTRIVNTANTVGVSLLAMASLLTALNRPTVTLCLIFSYARRSSPTSEPLTLCPPLACLSPSPSLCWPPAPRSQNRT